MTGHIHPLPGVVTENPTLASVAESNSPRPTAGVRTRAEVATDVDLAAEAARAAATALAEDLAFGNDATTEATVPAEAVATAAFVPRASGVLAGTAAAIAVHQQVGAGRLRVNRCAADGSVLRPGEPALLVTGPTQLLLTAERSALNLLTHLSGIATLTHSWVRAVEGTSARIRDTRKTIPGLRALQKAAVVAGGGLNHRMGLGDAVLIKDNHVLAAGSVAAAISAVRRLRPELPLEVEVDTLDQLDEALAAGAQVILLDNFSIAETAEAVRRTRSGHPGVQLESSGGLSLEVARAYAETGVDYLAVGALTHSAPALDIGMDLLPAS